MEELNKKVEIIDSKLDRISESQVRMEADILYHIKRTDQLENLVRKHDKFYVITMFIVAATPVIIGIAAGIKRLL